MIVSSYKFPLNNVLNALKAIVKTAEIGLFFCYSLLNTMSAFSIRRLLTMKSLYSKP